ncbi:MAG: class I tRNA ligase family protein, partial [Elusimicrobiaceae bacterium]|nr:class I tRNA ligase family protein [Elusimicrobiaceae bacterium]
NVITHGMILDQQGRAMHKSAGNSIEPDEITNKYGADILRMWVSFTDYSEDVRISQEILAGPIESYRKIRNTLRYALGNLYDFNPMKHTVVGNNLTELDKYMMSRLDNLIKEVLEAYKNFEFRKAIRKITDFCILDLSSLMLDASKDRLYTIGAEAQSRRSAQTVLAETILALVKLLAPVLCFTAEEVWQELKKLPLGTYLEESVFLSDMPTKVSYVCPEDITTRWHKITTIRPQVLKALEEARQKGIIGAPLEARVIFNSSDPNTKEFLRQTLKFWCEVAIVSQVEIAEEETEDELSIKVVHALGQKCARCWQWHEDLGQNPEYLDLCPRCTKVIEENE